MDTRSVCILIDEIYAMSHLLCLLFCEVEDAAIRVNPHAVARIGKMIETDIREISEKLDESGYPP